jgi:hypothetical protein
MTQQIKEMNMNIKLSPKIQFSKDNKLFKIQLSIQLCNFNKMQSFYTCIRINNKQPKRENAKCKMYFLYFRYEEMKIEGLNNNLIYRPHCKKKETNQAGYQEENTQPKMQGQPMKKMIRKKNHLKIQPKKGFLSLCRHSTVMKETQEDSRTIKTHPTNTKLNNQEKKIDVRDRLRKKCICMCSIE